MNESKINDPFQQKSPVDQLYLRLKGLGVVVEREWRIDEEGSVFVKEDSSGIKLSP